MRSTSTRTIGWLLGIGLCVGCAHQEPAAKPKTATAKAAQDEKVDPPEPDKTAVAEPPAAVPDERPDAIYFDFDSAILREDARDALAKVATELKQRDRFTLAIEGNCDAQGTVEYNLALGQQRAEAARDFLIRMGLPRKRIKTASFGSQRPKYSGRGEEAYAKNRRDDLIIH